MKGKAGTFEAQATEQALNRIIDDRVNAILSQRDRIKQPTGVGGYNYSRSQEALENSSIETSPPIETETEEPEA